MWFRGLLRTSGAHAARRDILRPAVLTALLATPVFSGTTLYVDAGATGGQTGQSWSDAFTDLQAALAAAGASRGAVTEIWVAQGTYRPAPPHGDRSASFRLLGGVALYGGFAGTENSRDERDPATHQTVLSGDLNGDDGPDFGNYGDNSRTVVSATDLGQTTTLDGFTVRDGENSGLQSTNGAAIQIKNASAVIRNCLLAANFGGATTGSPALYCTGGILQLVGCAIQNNSNGGIRLQGASDATISDCTITGNTYGLVIDSSSGVQLRGCRISGNGKGVLCTSTTIDIQDCVFEHNDDCGVWLSKSTARVIDSQVLSNAGSGIECQGGNSTIAGCTIRGNTSDYYGAGIYCVGQATIERCRILENRATLAAGGLFFHSCNATISDSVIARNSAREEGGGFQAYSGTITLRNCTLTGNSAGLAGGAISCAWSATADLSNSICWGNTAPSGPEVALRHNLSQLIVARSDLAGGVTAVDLGNGGQVSWQEGNLNVDPGFAFPDDPHLLAGSPCIDAGTDSAGIDLDGNIRPMDGNGDGIAIADMGAYEYNPQVPAIAVSAEAIDFFMPVGGLTPPDGTLSVRNAGGDTLAWQITGECSWLEVVPRSGLCTTGTADVALHVLPGAPYGASECILSVEDSQGVASPRIIRVRLNMFGQLAVPSEYPTIQAAIDAAQAERDEVLVASGIYTGAGNYDLDFRGKAITVRGVEGASTTIIDCGGAGRGFYFHTGEDARSVLDGFTIRNGKADSGGAVCCTNGTGPLIANCVMEGNSASYRGGAIQLTYSNAVLRGCMIRANSASEGGGMACDSSAPEITNCILAANSAAWEAGGLHCSDSNPVITGCTIAANSAPQSSALVAYYDSAARLTSSIIWANTGAPYAVRVVENGSFPSSLSVSYSNVQGGRAGVYVGPTSSLDWGPGDIDVDPLFAFEDDYHLMPGSPCIDAGGELDTQTLLPTDAENLPRRLDGNVDGNVVIDMGALEFDPTRPRLAFSPGHLAFAATTFGPDPESQRILIRNAGGGWLHWQVQSSCDWLVVSPDVGDVGTVPAVITITPRLSRLQHGTHFCVITIAGEGTGNSPARIDVRLDLSTTLRVPQNFPTIQSAIDAAIVPGDIVLVADGTFTGPGNRDIDLLGKRITVRSENGPDRTILDIGGAPSQPHRAFYLHLAETAETVIDGFTMQHGCSNPSQWVQGAGVYCDSDATIRNCVIAENDGHGLYVESGSPKVLSCLFRKNKGGLYIQTGSAEVTGCTFTENTIDGGISSWYARDMAISNCTFVGNSAGTARYPKDGGAIRSGPYMRTTIENCIITGNSAESGGGVSGNYSGQITLRGCVIIGNAATGTHSTDGLGGGIGAGGDRLNIIACRVIGNSGRLGAGVYSAATNTDVAGCILNGNTASQAAGGIWITRGALTNCVVSGNTAVTDGAGIYSQTGNQSIKTLLTNCSVFGNTAQGRAGGVFSADGGIVAANCILWANRDAAGDNQAAQIWSAKAGLIVDYTCIQGLTGSLGGAGNIGGDPRFVDADGPDNIVGTADDDLYLRPDSPCVDAGKNASVPTDTATDLDGNPRFLDDPSRADTGLGVPPIVDLGAYEFLAGDYDRDGDVDLVDLAVFQACVSGPAVLYAGDCLKADLDHDGDVDLADFGIFQRCYNGAHQQVNPNSGE